MRRQLFWFVISMPSSVSPNCVSLSSPWWLQFLYICCNKSLKFTQTSTVQVKLLQIQHQITVHIASVSKWHWATSLFDLAFRWAFRWAEVRSKTRLKSKSEVISLSLSLSWNFGLRPKFRLSERLSERLRHKVRSKYRLRPKLSWTNPTEVGRICIGLNFR